jgi:hypothetical protein
MGGGDGVTEVVHILAIDKPFLSLKEAAALACVSESHFRQQAPEIGIPRCRWLGKWVYRRADILAAMEAQWQQSENDDDALASIGRSTGETPTGDSVASRLAALQKSRGQKSRSSGQRRKSRTGASVEPFPSRPHSQNGQGNI